jgi:hypothetical protein
LVNTGTVGIGGLHIQGRMGKRRRRARRREKMAGNWEGGCQVWERRMGTGREEC